MRRLDQNQIVAISRDRAINETMMCRSMYNVFNSPPLIGRLREFIALAIEQVCVLACADGGRSELLWTNAIRAGGRNLAVWRHSGQGRLNNVRSLVRVLDRSDDWTAADCSDLIRLFGELVENPVLQNHGLTDKGVERFKDQQRFGPGFLTRGPGKQRAREGGGYYPTGSNQSRLPHIVQAHRSVLDFKRQPGFSGIENVSLMDCSTVKKIDSTYGLAEGCDISGTTADSIFFMKHVQDFIRGLPQSVPDDLLPALQLLPMATMASQGHHTVLECALTLTLNRIVQYRVGFYSTLRPTAGALPAALAGVLDVAERNDRNKHILCYWEGNRLQGVYYDRPGEINLLRQASLAHGAFRWQFHQLPLKPTAAELFGLPSFRMLPH